MTIYSHSAANPKKASGSNHNILRANANTASSTKSGSGTSCGVANETMCNSIQTTNTSIAHQRKLSLDNDNMIFPTTDVLDGDVDVEVVVGSKSSNNNNHVAAAAAAAATAANDKKDQPTSTSTPTPTASTSGTSAASTPKSPQLEQASAVCAQGRQAWTQGDASAALQHFQHALQLLETQLGTFHALTAKTYYWLGFILRHDPATLDQALQAFLQTARIRIVLLGATHASTQEALAAITYCLDEQGSSPDAIKTYILHLQDSIRLETLGDAHLRQRQFGQADLAYQQALATFPDPTHATLVGKRAFCSFRTGKEMVQQEDPNAAMQCWNQALLWYRQALFLFTQTVHQQEHPDIPTTLDRMQQVLLAQGLQVDKDEVRATLLASVRAEHLAEQAMANRQHPQTLDYWQQAVDLESQLFGSDHVLTQERIQRMEHATTQTQSPSSNSTHNSDVQHHNGDDNNQDDVVQQLQEENRVLREQLLAIQNVMTLEEDDEEESLAGKGVREIQNKATSSPSKISNSTEKDPASANSTQDQTVLQQELDKYMQQNQTLMEQAATMNAKLAALESECNDLRGYSQQGSSQSMTALQEQLSRSEKQVQEGKSLLEHTQLDLLNAEAKLRASDDMMNKLRKEHDAVSQQLETEAAQRLQAQEQVERLEQQMKSSMEDRLDVDKESLDNSFVLEKRNPSPVNPKDEEDEDDRPFDTSKTMSCDTLASKSSDSWSETQSVRSKQRKERSNAIASLKDKIEQLEASHNTLHEFLGPHDETSSHHCDRLIHSILAPEKNTKDKTEEQRDRPPHLSNERPAVFVLERSNKEKAQKIASLTNELASWEETHDKLRVKHDKLKRLFKRLEVMNRSLKEQNKHLMLSIHCNVDRSKSQNRGSASDANLVYVPFSAKSAPITPELRQCVKVAPSKFTTNLAEYAIRKPFNEENEELFSRPDLLMTPNAYAVEAHVSIPSSIDVAATISHDNSLLYLSGQDGVRHKPVDGQWVDLGNANARTEPLGFVSFNKDGMQSEYSLDAVLEEAIVFRQQYCEKLLDNAKLSSRSWFQLGAGSTGLMELDIFLQKIPLPMALSFAFAILAIVIAMFLCR
eukprot:Nitzschia sp. Nitz4//scaffold151_size53849//30850//34131//NITZ4_006724-RA/size53849-processed-gene-0.73-mRNA-1//-1//CDS//3329537147//3113//frame0